MTPPRRRAALPLALTAATLLLAGCTAAVPDAAPPSALPSASAGAPETARVFEPLAIPAPAEGELARVTFTAVGPDGVPTSEGVISAAPEPDRSYALEGECIPSGEPVTVSYRIVATDEAAAELQAGTFRCDGTGIQNVGVLDTTLPPQVMFTATDGADEAYLRLVPYDG